MSLKLNDLKKDLGGLPQPELVQVVLRLARLKIENKELIHYLLYYAHDSSAYVEVLMPEVLDPFEQEFLNSYALSKRLRKSMRVIAKYLRFTSDRAGESELLLAVVSKYLATYRYEYRHAALSRIIVRCLKKTHDNFEKIHEDYRADYIDSYNNALKAVKSKLGVEVTSGLQFKEY
ncbi:MAG: hypothetical protein WED33_13510 [Bacteroidia bacterium]